MQAIQENKQKFKDNSLSAQWLRRCFQLFTILPMLWLLVFAAFVGATWLEVGHIPTYGTPDPKDTLLAWFFLPANYILLPLAISSLVGWFIWAAMAELKLIPLRVRLYQFLLIGIPVMLFFVIRHQTALFDWFMD